MDCQPYRENTDNVALTVLQSSILIVDDRPGNVALLEMLLKAAGYTNVESTMDPREVRSLYLDGDFDLILLDLRMPNMDGFQVMEQLAACSKDDYLPILVLTADKDETVRNRALRSGAKDFVSKPFDREEILNRIYNLLEVRSLYKERRFQAELLEAKIEARTFELLRAKEEAEKANKAKTTFLAHMSHELRTPLNSILGYSEMITCQSLGPVDNEKYIEAAKTIHASGTHLLGIVSDLLDTSMMETGALQIEKKNINVRDVVQDTVKIISQSADAAKLKLVVQIADDVPDLPADAGRLKQILINLLSNAIKFTPVGGVVDLQVKVCNTGYIAFQVSDTGVGIAADDIQKILKPFGQVKNVLVSKSQEGVGLGLPLAKSLTEAHGGTISIKSALGEGTEVVINLPTELSTNDHQIPDWVSDSCHKQPISNAVLSPIN